MQIYFYDEFTNEYLFEEEADKDPMASNREGVFIPLIPQFCTLIVPLPSKDGFTQIFNEGNWEYVEDHRNEHVINTETLEETEVDYIGPLKENFVNYDTYINSEEYAQKIAEIEKEEQLAMLSVKITGLKNLCLEELLHENTENLNIYKDIINSLEQTKQELENN